MEQKIYSSEDFDRVLLSNIGTNGDELRTISISRPNRFTNIYINFKTSHLVKPTVYRGFIDKNDNQAYYDYVYPNIEPSADFEEVLFKWNPLHDENFDNYFVVFECLRTEETTIELDEIGVYFDNFEHTLNNRKSYSTSLVSDINQRPLTKQTYGAKQAFSIICNRTDVQTILNVCDKPFYLIDDKGCFNNNTKKMVLDVAPKINYITSATQLVELTIEGTPKI